MTKILSPSKFSEWKGLDRIALIVHEMRCVWRELSKDDFGIDGEIEVAVPREDGKSYEVTGKILKVQSKSGVKYVTQDSATNFATPVSKDDLEYWYNSAVPVLFIVYHPKDDKLYFKEVKSYVRHTKNVFQQPWKIVFDKTTDEFAGQCYDRVCTYSESSPPRVLVGVKEKLYSNLLPVLHRPRLISCAPTTYRDHAQVKRELRESVFAFRITGGTLYTFENLRDYRCPLRRFCDAGSTETLQADDWISDPVNRRDYVALLNELLRGHMDACEFRYSRDHRRYYCPRPEEQDAMESKMTWRNIRTGRENTRTVAKHYKYGIDEFWRHDAVYINFTNIGHSWYLQVIPRYLFTTDGRTLFDNEKVGPYTTRIRAQETNIQVLTDVLFWSDALSSGKDRITLGFGEKPLVVVGKMPSSAVATFAIPADPAIMEEVAATGQLDLDMLWDAEKDEKDDLYEY